MLRSLLGDLALFSRNLVSRIKRCISTDTDKLSANISLQKKQHNEIQYSEIPGFEKLQGGPLTKLFSSMNLVSIQVLEHEHTVGDPKAT